MLPRLFTLARRVIATASWESFKKKILNGLLFPDRFHSPRHTWRCRLEGDGIGSREWMSLIGMASTFARIIIQSIGRKRHGLPAHVCMYGPVPRLSLGMKKVQENSLKTVDDVGRARGLANRTG